MQGIYTNVRIKGINTVVPVRCIENTDYFGTLGEKKVKKQMKLTGIQRCHIAGDGETTEEMCFRASEELLTRLSWDRSRIRALILVTQTPSCLMPSTAFLLQKRLSLGEDCMVFDINLGCSAYTAGLQVIAGLLQKCGEGAKGLLVVGDTVSHCVGQEDYQTKMMFGDGAAATAVEIQESSKMSFMQKSDGSQYDKIFRKDWQDSFYMDGMAVFHFTINQVVKYIGEFKERFEIPEEDIDFYVFHQAQKYIIDNLVEFAQIPEEKVLTSYQDYGNTAGASIPITLCSNVDALKKLGKERVRLLLCGFGVGLSCGCVWLEVDPEEIASLPLKRKEEE